MQSAHSLLEKIKEILDPETINLRLMHTKINMGSRHEILSMEQLRAIYTYVLNQADLLQQIDALPINASIRLEKLSADSSELPRTCVIQRFPDGHLELIVLTNLKFADNSKFSKTFDGSSKKDKDAYRIDDVRAQAASIRWVRLQYRLSEYGRTSPQERAKRLKRIQDEADVSQMITSDFVSPIFVGSPYTHAPHRQRREGIYAFAKPGLYTLNKFMQRINDEPNMQIYRQHPELLDSIVLSLLQGLLDIHAKQIIHTDLDVTNIIVRTRGEELICQYIDFAGAINLAQGPSSKYGGTLDQASPEMSAAIMYKLMLECYTSWDMGFIPNPNTFAYDLVELAATTDNRYANQTVFDFKDNSWSLGVMLFKLFTGVTPRLNTYTLVVLEQNPLLKGLLAPTRAARFSAQEALDCWQKNPVFIPVTHNNDYTLQDNINAKLETVKDKISLKPFNQRLDTAISLIKECINLSTEICDPLIKNCSLYKSPEILQQDVIALETALQNHMDSLTTRGPAIATNVCANVTKLLTEIQLAAIKDAVRNALSKHWSNMYGNDDDNLAIGLQRVLDKALQQSAIYSCLWGCLSVRYVIDIPKFECAVLSHVQNIGYIADNHAEINLPSQAQPSVQTSTQLTLGYR